MKIVPRALAALLAAAVAATGSVAAAGESPDAARPRRAALPLPEEVRRDRQELETFQEIFGVLQSTASRKNRKEYMKLDLDLHESMVREVEQAEVKAERARRENVELPAERALARHGAQAGGRDLASPEGRHEWMRDLVREAEDLLPRLQKWDERALARNRELLGEFLDAMVADFRASGGEWKAERI
jgi:hypothetical protein